ncbi:hypothetical protein SMA75_26170, partial [Escherichia coli]|uniref:hypothetical protein n=1 Tax=Escherichia coli TaxID=562 RepID=UPI00307AB2C4
ILPCAGHTHLPVAAAGLEVAVVLLLVVAEVVGVEVVVFGGVVVVGFVINGPIELLLFDGLVCAV